MKFAVMGSPIAHSLSPILHRAAFQFLGIQASYEAVEKTRLEVEDLGDYSGLSLTMPLKIDAFDLADNHDDESLATGVSNTLLISEKRIFALNTDVYGIAKSIEKIDATRVQIIGTGATARSAAIAVRDKQVCFAGRDQKKLKNIETWASEHDISLANMEQVDLVIDTTPENSSLDYVEHSYVLDVAYSSNRNSQNPKLISGLEMLLHQAVSQHVAFSTPLTNQKIAFQELTQVMRGALVARVGEWSNA